MLEAAILTALRNQTSAGASVFGDVLPNPNTKPAITFQRISSVPVTSIVGATSGLERVRVQVDCWAATKAAALALDAEIRPLMAAASFKGLPDTTFSEFEEETRLYRFSRDYFCWEETQ